MSHHSAMTPVRYIPLLLALVSIVTIRSKALTMQDPFAKLLFQKVNPVVNQGHPDFVVHVGPSPNVCHQRFQLDGELVDALEPFVHCQCGVGCAMPVCTPHGPRAFAAVHVQGWGLLWDHFDFG